MSINDNRNMIDVAIDGHKPINGDATVADLTHTSFAIAHTPTTDRLTVHSEAKNVIRPDHNFVAEGVGEEEDGAEHETTVATDR